MITATSSAALFDDPDQTQVISDLATFFGPKADRFLEIYEKIRSKPAKKRPAAMNWNWSVFFLSFSWFFYRKMYILGATMILVPIIVSMLFGSAGSGAYIIFPMYANTWYVNSALRRVAKANELGLVGTEREDYLSQAGGVSTLGGGLAALLFIALLGLAILGTMQGTSSGTAG